MTKTTSERHAALDGLRIISMLMVVGMHYCNHGGLLESLTPGSVNWYLINWFYGICFCSVNCFILLCGYFQCTATFKLKRIASIWVQAAFYSVGLYLLVSISCGNFVLAELIKSGMVVTLKRYWFVTAYILLYAVSPFLNCAINAMNKRMHLLCCSALLFLFSVAHNVVYISDFGNVNGGSSFLWFCVMYVVGAYIRKYTDPEQPKKYRHFSLFIIFASLVSIFRFAAIYITPRIFGRVVLDSIFHSNNSIPITAASIMLFLSLRSVKIKCSAASRVIGFFAPISFGVYLIHDHPAIRPLLWQFLDSCSLKSSPLLLPYVILCIAGIFAICCAVEWIRKRIFDICRINKAINCMSNWIQAHLKHKLHKLP